MFLGNVINMSNRLSVVDSQQLIRAAVDVATKQAEASQVAKDLANEKGIPLVEAKRILLAATEMTEQELKDQMSGQMGVVVSSAMARLEKEVDRLDPKDLMKVIKDGATVMQQVKGEPTKKVEHTVTVGDGNTADEMRKRLASVSAKPIEVEAEKVE